MEFQMDLKKSVLVLAAVICLFGCGKSENSSESYLKNAAINRLQNTTDFPGETVYRFMNSKNITEGLINQQFLDISLGAIDTPDSLLVIDLLVEFSQFLKSEPKEVGTESITASHFKFGNLQLRSTRTCNTQADKFAEEAVLLQNEKVIYKVIYKSANVKVQTELSAQQLIDLLKQNGWEISVIAYAENKKAKAALLSLKKFN
jgi:uncharacterized lipoprotein YehR (DUF1307 family)